MRLGAKKSPVGRRVSGLWAGNRGRGRLEVAGARSGKQGEITRFWETKQKTPVDWKQNWQNSGIGVAEFRNEPKRKVTLQSDFSGTPITSFCHAIITK